MITPAFGLTATERVLPKLALDFTTASLDSRITFTRTTGASNPATYVNSNGYITAATNNQPRFDYDPVALTCKGLLIEESRTNSAKQSDAFDTATWSKTRLNTTGSPAWVNVAVSPDGTQNSDKIIEDTTATSTHFIYQSAIGTFTNVTLSVFAKASERYKMALREDTSTGKYVSVNLQTGAILDSSASDANYTITPSITNYGNGWYRVSLAMATSISSARGIQILLLPDSYTSGSPTTGASLYTGDGTSGIYIWGAQLEAGAFATSYIPTTTTALTRNADVAVMTGTNFSDWFNASEGAFQTNISTLNVAGTRSGISIKDSGTSNYLFSRIETGGVAASRSNVSGVSQTVFTISSVYTANVSKGMVFAYKLNDAQFSANGVQSTPDTSCTVPTVDRMEIGAFAGVNVLNGHVQKIMYWPQRITNNETQAFSK